MAKRTKKTMHFSEKLVLFNWLLSLFEVKNIEELSYGLKGFDEDCITEDGFSRYYGVLTARLFDRVEITSDMLAKYDQRIVRYWKQITEKREANGKKLYPKYFQYLSLLFTEIYLDRYFTSKEKLLDDLNRYLDSFNEKLPEKERIEAFNIENLNKISLWNATGSGKTLLMHINILQYKYYLARENMHKELNKVILLTPNEGLSNQHNEELTLSGLTGDIFDKAGSMPLTHLNDKPVEIIEISKLSDTSGDKTIAVEAFEDNNLVLIDEGHRGTSGGSSGKWMERRNCLCENGFSFEYSATFGQAVKKDKKLINTYAKSIIFDYSYKFFYEDGYGKDYRILNLEDDRDQQQRVRYLTACLMAFYQQQKLFNDKRSELKKFLIEKPLWIFVGSSVTKTISKKDVSDIIDILLFLAEFANNSKQSVSFIDDFLKGKSGLLNSRGSDLLSTNFTYLASMNDTEPAQLYNDVLRTLFNSNSAGLLHVRNLKGSDGEIALSLGENEPFGVINVGDSDKLCKLCEKHKQMVVSDEPFSKSLFRNINSESSNINLLIGSRKFTEGWSSWRVSTMGLMNIGKNEGSQIIQLFGRGVRLKGLDFSLKRSSKTVGAKAPDYISMLETLNIFGIHADYMSQFKEYLKEQGLPVDGDKIEFILPVLNNLGKVKLKTIKLKEGVSYKKQAPKPTLGLPDRDFKRRPIEINWYPKVQSIMSYSATAAVAEGIPDVGCLTPDHVSLLNIDEIYFELIRYKNERSWYNLNIDRNVLKRLLDDTEWYKVYIPAKELAFDSFTKVPRWQELAVALLKKYTNRCYENQKANWEKEHLEYRELRADDPNFVKEYEFAINASRRDIIAKLEKVKKLIESKQLEPAEFTKLDIDLPGFNSIAFNNHLYQPLLWKTPDCDVEIKPVALVDSEKNFLLDIKTFCRSNEEYFADKQLYILRNRSRGKGVGFFEAGNFYPDFIVWLVAENKQHISFVDPKGLRNLNGIKDAKIEFHKKIKEIETRLNDPDVVLNSFIISESRYLEINWIGTTVSKSDLDNRNVLFMKEDKHTYIRRMFDKIIVLNNTNSQTSHILHQNSTIDTEKIEHAMAILDALALLYVWNKSVDRRAFEVGMLLMQRDELRRRVANLEIKKDTTKSNKQPCFINFDEFLGELAGTDTVIIETRDKRQLISLGKNALELGNKLNDERVNKAFHKAEECLKAIRKLNDTNLILDDYCEVEDYAEIEFSFS
ncbi:MAG: DEAD/DEAH box helicase family protein [Sedimentisphaeraceae bacterium JB056]